MLKRFMSLVLVANVLWVGLLVVSPRAATGGPFGPLFLTTCVGFDASLQIKGDAEPRFAVVYVHNFGFDTAGVVVRFANFGNDALASQSDSIPPGETRLFFFGSVQQAPPNEFATYTFLIAQVISGEEDLLVDAENVYEHNLSSAKHRRHVGCARTEASPQQVTRPTPKR